VWAREQVAIELAGQHVRVAHRIEGQEFGKRAVAAQVAAGTEHPRHENAFRHVLARMPEVVFIPPFGLDAVPQREHTVAGKVHHGRLSCRISRPGRDPSA
jgi:hypothetical protein